MPKTCPLCDSNDVYFYYKDTFRSYYQCVSCQLVFVPEEYHLSAEEEKARYELHENDPNDEGYRQFLKRFFEPMNERIPNRAYGLDFGSGPGPTLHLMFEEAGHSMEIYDLFFEDNLSVFKQKYGFICATEVVEHLYQPMNELNRLWGCLKPGGFLGLMTKLVHNKEAFKKWHYIRDETHISFFSKKTFQWIGNQWNANLDFIGNDIIIFEKTD